ncbi:MAG: DUF177 domain-containing protein [Xanthomonadales bacterium]|nr:DUF177 domain-containing protein [Xanthomonadales bacterium]
MDVERAVATGRVYSGSVPLSVFERLAGLLADTRGELRFELKFGRNEIGQRMATLQADAALPLVCQTTLDRFELPVRVDVRLGLIADEADEAGLPEGFEAALMDAGLVDPLALLEDELILAVPVIARKPGVEVNAPAPAPAVEEERPHPFAALAGFKRESRNI